MPEVEIPPRPADTEATCWDWVDNQWVERQKRPDEMPVVEEPVEPVEPIPQEQVDRIVAQDAARAAVRALLVELQAEKNRVQAIIDKPNASITGADTKDLARALKRIADAAIDLAKLVT